MLEYTIQIPEISGSVSRGTERAFKYYYSWAAAKSLRHIRHELYPQAIKQYKYAISMGYPFFNYVYMSKPEVALICPELVSLYIDVYEYTGGAHGMTVRTGDTWDLSVGRMVSLNRLFKKGYNFTKAILNEIERQVREDQANGEDYYFDDVNENIIKYFVPSDFYLTNESLVIFYQLYTIAPYSSGILTFEINYNYFGENFIYQIC
jgi:hypothetical protein